MNATKKPLYYQAGENAKDIYCQLSSKQGLRQSRQLDRQSRYVQYCTLST